MTQGITGLTLNGHFFALTELIKFCKAAIESNTEPEWKLDVHRFILEFLNDLDVIIQKTSGTTGESKTIELPKKSMLVSAKNTIDFFQLKENEVAVLCLPIKYIAGKMMVVRALVSCMNLILIEPNGTPDFSASGKIDFCAMVPMQVITLLQNKNWPLIKTLILGGAETSPELIKNMQALETKVFESYGMAETCSHVALKRINGKNPEPHFSTLPNVQITSDERDCLIIDAAYLPGKIITNDRVELIARNKFNWLGRIDNVINSGGIKIQAEILEKQIHEILEIPCVISSEPDPVFGQKIMLIVESESEMDENQILEKLALFMNKKMVPKSVRIVKKIPRNKSFKIDRLKLKENFKR